jgi:chromosome segregation ATPase
LPGGKGGRPLGMGTEVASFDELATLEVKIGRIADQMDEIRNVNGQLNDEISQLREELVSRDQMVEDLRRDLELARKERRDIVREDLIRGKLTTLLDKIESLESVSA